MKTARFKDKGKGFPKNLFSLLKVGRRRRHRRLKKPLEKEANFFTKIFKDKFKGMMKKKILIFFF